MLRAALERARVDAYGEPLDWPEYVSDHAPEAVEAALFAAERECGESADLARIDCDEPPCIGVFRLAEDDSSAAFRLQSCAPWYERYGASAAISMRTVDCGGAPIRLLLLSPAWPIELTPSVSEESLDRRLGHRWDLLSESSCQ